MRVFGWLRRKPAPETASPTSEPPRWFTALVAGRQRAVGVSYMLPADTQVIHRLDFQRYFCETRSTATT